MGYGCDHCRVKPSDWNDIELVKEQWPYPLDRDMESMERVKARMEVDAKGDYKKKPNDWDTREGCVRPMTGLRKPDDFQLTHKVSLVSTNQVFLPHFMHTYVFIHMAKEI